MTTTCFTKTVRVGCFLVFSSLFFGGDFQLTVSAKDPASVRLLRRGAPATQAADIPAIAANLENYRALDRQRSKESWQQPMERHNRAVAFSVSGDNMTSKGGETAIRFAETHTNTNQQAWLDGGSHFRAPVAGIYLFTISFTSERHPSSDGDDVYMVIRKNGQQKGFAFAGNVGEFESPDNSAPLRLRMSGTYTVTLNLAVDDVVHTGVVDDLKRSRFIRFFNMTGVLLQPLDDPTAVTLQK